MNEETIFDQNEVKREKQGNAPLNNDETVLDGQPNPVQDEAQKSKKKKTLGTAGIAGVSGVAGAALGVLVLTPMNLFPEAPDDGSEIEEISNEGGESAPAPSTHLVGHDMDVATGVNDSMSFNQAFAAARQEVGPGGIFVWHGHTYGTYYASEWNSMSPEEHDQYWADVHHTTSNLNELAHETSDTDSIQEEPMVGQDPLTENHGNDNQGESNGDENPTEPEPPTSPSEGEELTNNSDGDEEPSEVQNDPDEPIVTVNSDEPIDEPESLVLNEEDVIEVYDLDGDGAIDAAIVDANGNEMADVILDTTGDGSFDTLIIDPEVNNDGELSVAEVHDIDDVVVVEGDGSALDGVEDLDEMLPLNEIEQSDLDDSLVGETPDVDDLASFESDPDVTIDNNMDMSDFA